MKKRRIRIKTRIRFLKALWDVLKYDVPEELVIVAAWHIDGGHRRVGLTSIQDCNKGTLLDDLRMWSLSPPETFIVSHSKSIKEANQNEGLFAREGSKRGSAMVDHGWEIKELRKAGLMK